MSWLSAPSNFPCLTAGTHPRIASALKLGVFGLRWAPTWVVPTSGRSGDPAGLALDRSGPGPDHFVDRLRAVRCDRAERAESGPSSQGAADRSARSQIARKSATYRHTARPAGCKAEEELDVSWGGIAQVQLFEQMVLIEARRLMAEKNLTRPLNT